MRTKRRSFADLRADYDRAFEQLALQVRELKDAESGQARDEARIRTLRRKVDEAEAGYRCSRDVLAAYMLRRPWGKDVDYCLESPDNRVSELTASFHSTTVGSFNQ